MAFISRVALHAHLITSAISVSVSNDLVSLITGRNKRGEWTLLDANEKNIQS